MTYVEAINELLLKRLSACSHVHCIGQNIASGSHLSGLSRGIEEISTAEVLHSPNCENSLAGFGFGVMLEGGHTLFIVKQLDFLLLTLDQLVNTYNIARLRRGPGSFTILAVVVDSGFEGPQSRLNNLSDFCSLTGIPGYSLAHPSVAATLLEKELGAPGVRILTVSQRLLRSNPESIAASPIDSRGEFFHIAGSGSTAIVAFNFAWPHALELEAELRSCHIDSRTFGVASASPADWGPLIRQLRGAERLVLIDDSRSIHRPLDRLRSELADEGCSIPCYVSSRTPRSEPLGPNADAFEVDFRSISHWIQRQFD